MLGLLGSYVLLGTIGVSGSLPITYNPNTNISIKTNSNFYNYFMSLNDLSSKQSVGLIVDYFTKDDIDYSELFQIHICRPYQNIDEYVNDIVYNYSSIISHTYNNDTQLWHDIAFFSNFDISNDTTYKDFTIDFVEGVHASTTYPYTINQVYYARPNGGGISGSAITDGITGGLGLMEDITKQFGSGFATLIWDSSKNSLTTFGNFALIFLGVSITFSIVKLCLSLIRSKTGS